MNWNFLQIFNPLGLRAHYNEQQQRVAKLEEENRWLQQSLAWKSGPYAVLEHYVKNIHTTASEHPGKLAIAIFSCSATLPFDPFQYALDTRNNALNTPTLSQRNLAPSEDWYGRFLGYYCTLDSHLLDIYKKKNDPQGQPLASPQQDTLTGVMRDLQSPVFDEVLETKQIYRTFLPKETYGLDMVVKVFPLFDEVHNIIGMISFTHDITMHLEQQGQIADGLKQVNQSALSIMKQVDTVQEVSSAIQNFSLGIDTLEQSIQHLIVDVNTLNKVLFSSIRAIRMLSVNSSVEAARAGVAGKGFKVISNQIHDLTEEMSQAIKQLESVNDQIDSIKSDSVGKLYQINELSGKINSLVHNLKSESASYQDLLSTISNAEESYKHFIHTMIA